MRILLIDLGAFFAASNLKTPQKTGLYAPIPQRQPRTLAGFPLQSLARFRIQDSFLRGFLLTIFLVQTGY
jgi:hypothetical protein